MDSVDYPRVLHLGFRPMGAHSNTGITLQRLFADWPRERLLQLVFGESSEAPGDCLEVAPIAVSPIDGLSRRLRGRSRTDVEVTSSALLGRGKWGKGSAAIVLARALHDLSPVAVPRSLVDRLRRFQPDVIHTEFWGVRSIRLATQLSRQLDIPIVPHFMDNWLDTSYTSGPGARWYRRAFESAFRSMLSRTNSCLVVGEDMAMAYQDRLRIPCVPAGNIVEREIWEDAIANAVRRRAPKPITLRYFGGIGPGRIDGIAQLAQAISTIDTNGMDWAVELYVPPAQIPAGRALQDRCTSVSTVQSVPPPEVPRLAVESDALLFVESTKPEDLTYTKYSVSTKVPEYLASRRPALVRGPSNQASVRELMRGGRAVAAPLLSHDPAWALCLDSLALLVKRWDTGVDEALGAALERFDATAVRARMRAALRQAAVEHRRSVRPPGIRDWRLAGRDPTAD